MDKDRQENEGKMIGDERIGEKEREEGGHMQEERRVERKE